MKFLDKSCCISLLTHYMNKKEKLMIYKSRKNSIFNKTMSTCYYYDTTNVKIVKEGEEESDHHRQNRKVSI